MQVMQDGSTHLLRVSGWVAGVAAAPAVPIVEVAARLGARAGVRPA